MKFYNNNDPKQVKKAHPKWLSANIEVVTRDHCFSRRDRIEASMKQKCPNCGEEMGTHEQALPCIKKEEGKQ